MGTSLPLHITAYVLKRAAIEKRTPSAILRHIVEESPKIAALKNGGKAKSKR